MSTDTDTEIDDFVFAVAVLAKAKRVKKPDGSFTTATDKAARNKLLKPPKSRLHPHPIAFTPPMQAIEIYGARVAYERSCIKKTGRARSGDF